MAIIFQTKYSSDLLSRSCLTDSNTASTPLDTNVKLTSFYGTPITYPTLYWRLVGNLVYLTVTRPDIVYVMNIVTQFMAAPRTAHFTVVLHIVRYVKVTTLHGLHLSARSSLILTGYTDAYWAGDRTDRRSTTGY